MQVIIFGVTGMVGQGVLRECLIDPGIDRVLAVGRSPTGVRNAKLVEIIHNNFLDYSASRRTVGFPGNFGARARCRVSVPKEKYRRCLPSSN